MLLKILLAALCGLVCDAALAGGRGYPPQDVGRGIPPPRANRGHGFRTYRPCKDLSVRCIQNNLAVNSGCSRRVPGFAPAQFVVPRVDYNTPYFNATYTDLKLFVRGLDRCKVVEYLYNPLSDNEVLGIECRDLNFESDRTLYQHYSLKEDVVLKFHINGTYPLIRLTTTLRHGNGLNICRETTFADVAVLPIFHIDPKDKLSSDSLTTDLKQLYIYERELFASRANLLAHKFVNNVICDFQC